MLKKQVHTNTNPSLSEEELDARKVLFEDEVSQIEHDLATEQLFDTQHTDGHTYNPHLAWEQGLTYTPPHDPPVVASDNPQGAEIAAGFGQSLATNDIETAKPLIGDLELQNKIDLVLRHHSKTKHLTDIIAYVQDGIVSLVGSVEKDEEIALVDDILHWHFGVRGLRNDIRSREP